MSEGLFFKAIPNGPVALTTPIIEAILDLVRRGELKQGDKLPPQDVLAAQLKVSRTSLREALKELSYRGVVRCVHGRGTFVSERLTSNREIIEAREIIEPGAAILATERLLPEDCDELQRLVEAMESRVAILDFYGFSVLDMEFHMRINAFARNQALVFMMQTLQDVMLVQQLYVQKLPGAIRRAYDFHKKILACMKARDAEGAGRAMKEHLKDVADASNQDTLFAEDNGREARER
ncbi:MAG: FCD domain-containing protein [Synergistaceae bacterium]|nr:FCD domain-containing protein [Synergistaceae bacterium]